MNYIFTSSRTCFCISQPDLTIAGRIYFEIISRSDNSFYLLQKLVFIASWYQKLYSHKFCGIVVENILELRVAETA